MFHEGPIPERDPPPLTLESYVRGTTSKLPTNRERLHWLIRHAAVRRGRAADIGTKDGSAVKVLADMGWDASGYDPDSRFHGFAKQTYGIDIRRWFSADAAGRGSLDLVTAFHVLEHIPEPVPWLSEIREALKPDGHVYIETPNLRFVEARQLRPGHVVLYTAHTLRQVLERTGFRVLAMSECAPGGTRTFDQLSAVAQRDQPRSVDCALSRVDRAAERYLQKIPVDPLASPLFPVRLCRRVKRRLRRTFRRTCHRVL
ncbi:MAG: hypothetical protein A3I61_20015 [Acidobacteria bacterium RIFCSPLOWO2_02_FULL_68_18]|nr:MAG: hypothetical protein A3I61_20015 [Acidobacteria bacterium RIFCSPLOWO2_02_FULL_68_18]OFW48250.1 MAG: hypothetical protein A3G77_03125 [Acidobacteria bacterium RIFCSPLOWO2_12_FULL_68_19]